MSNFFRVQLGVVSRSEGHSAAKRAAYQACGVIVAYDGERFDFRRKRREHVRSVMLAPPDAPDWTHDPEALWARAAVAEKRVDSQEARIMDFSMPRAIPPHLWDDCIRHVYESYVRMGMVLQIDIHDAPASDGGHNVNVHAMATLREIEGDGFSARKNRAWNDTFRERNGRTVRERFAGSLTEFCQLHGIDYKGDARSNAERGLPDPEPTLPRWNFEATKRGEEYTPAIASLQYHRRCRRRWEEALAEQDHAETELRKLEIEIRRRRKRHVRPAVPERRPCSHRDRRAAVLRVWHGGGWIDAAVVSAITSTRYDKGRGALWIDLKDGTTLIDRGNAIALRGRLTWTAAMETAAAAERHGWKEIDVHGDQSYKDAVAVAAMLRGIRVVNHKLSHQAQVRLDRLLAARAMSSPRHDQLSSRNSRYGDGTTSASIFSHEIYRRIVGQSRAAPKDTDRTSGEGPPAPVLRPRRRAAGAIELENDGHPRFGRAMPD